MRILRKACTLFLVGFMLTSCNVPEIAGDFLKDFKHDFIEYVIKELQELNVAESEEEVTGEGAAELVYVVDGDTIIVSQNGEDFKVRMIGCNTPESVHEDETRNTVYGTYASDYTKELLKDVSVVYLEYDEEKHDDYDRVLAYVWLTEDRSIHDNMVNYILIRDGYAEVMTIKPNTKHTTAFTLAEAAAKAQGTGLWQYENAFE